MRAEKLNAEENDEQDSDKDEDKYVDEVDMPGTKVDSKQRITVRNLRIREDTAKYLRNLDPNSAYYDPKTRSMRDNPYIGTEREYIYYCILLYFLTLQVISNFENTKIPCLYLITEWTIKVKILRVSREIHNDMQMLNYLHGKHMKEVLMFIYLLNLRN